VPRAKQPKRTPADEAAKQAALEEVRRRVIDRLGEMVEAQIRSSVGIVHFMARDPYSGKFERLTDQNDITKRLNEPNAREGVNGTYYLATKDPNNQAFMGLLAYALDQPKKPAEDHTVHLTTDLQSKVDAARRRVHADHAKS
jgi:hypothetical protein